MPNVVGKSYSKAKKILEQAGLVVSPDSGSGTVSSQNPKAGTKVKKGDTVTLGFSSGNKNNQGGGSNSGSSNTVTKKTTITVTFNANGGSVGQTTKVVTIGSTYGNLPTPTRTYYSFGGWYTDPNGGTNVSAGSIAGGSDVTLYAHWYRNEMSGWVNESMVPSGAEIVDEKWTYDLTTKTSSGSSSMSGWDLYDTKRTSWGSTQGPVYYNPSNGSRYVWSEQYVSSTEDHFKYRHRWNRLSGNSGLWNYDDGTSASWELHSIDITKQLKLRWTDEYGNKWYGTWNGSDGDTCPVCGRGGMWEPCGSYTKNYYSTRWYYQEPVYTYYYTKTEAKESDTEVYQSDSISNIQKWVKYIEK